MRTRYLLAAPVAVGLALLLVLPSPAREAPSKEKIDKLIDKMGSGDFSEREQATKELAVIGAPALEALRKAAKSDDAEVRKRAEELLPKIERQAESARLLAPKRVHLVYKDTPLPEAVADFQKKSGYSMELYDPDGKVKERKITLDTGETSFWHALALFCEKAEVAEVNIAELMQAAQGQPGGAPGFGPPLPPPMPVPAGGKPAFQPAVGRQRQGMPGMADMPASNAQFLLRDGKLKKLPTDDRIAIRIRALAKSDFFAKAPEGEVIVPLEVTLEPKLQWEALRSIRIDKAVDDRDQTLAQVIPQVEGAVGAVGGPAGAQQLRMQMMMQQQMIKQRQMMMQMRGRGMGFRMMGGVSNEQAPVQLKKGAQEAKHLKELKGIITAYVLGEAQPLIVADKLKAGESFQGKEGGFIKIHDVKAQDEETTIRLEFEQPPFDKVSPAQQNGMRAFMGGGMAPLRIQAAPAARQPPPQPPPPPPRRPAALGAKQQQAPPAPAMPLQIAIGGGGAGFGGMPIMSSVNGLSVLDEKGNALLMQTQTSIQVQQQAGGVFKQTTTYTLTCRREKDKGQPAKVVFLGRKRVVVEIPFALKDVPLPK